MKAFKITGKFKMGQNDQVFAKEVLADDDASAREQILSVLGSKHGVKRAKVTIQKVEPVAVDDVIDPYIRSKLGG